MRLIRIIERCLLAKVMKKDDCCIRDCAIFMRHLLIKNVFKKKILLERVINKVIKVLNANRLIVVIVKPPFKLIISLCHYISIHKILYECNTTSPFPIELPYLIKLLKQEGVRNLYAFLE